VGTVASSDGRAPYDAAVSERMETGLAGSTGVPGSEADRATRASKLRRRSFSMGVVAESIPGYCALGARSRS
jgi:hypothetical protein